MHVTHCQLKEYLRCKLLYSVPSSFLGTWKTPMQLLSGEAVPGDKPQVTWAEELCVPPGYVSVKSLCLTS